MFLLDIIKFVSKLSFDTVVAILLFSFVLILIGSLVHFLPFFIIGIVGWLYWKGLVF